MKDAFERALQHAISGNAILFLGAGFTVGAECIGNEPLLASRDLSKRLCKDLGIDENPDLMSTSNYYVKKKGPETLVSTLKSMYTIKKFAHFHKDILLHPWQRIYTTNYDNIVEKIFDEEGIDFSSATLGNDPRDIPKKSRLILHINGSIQRINNSSLFSDFKLTTTSYLTEEFRNSDWNSYFLQDVHSAGAIFFVGYSMYDIDIARLLWPEKELRQKTHFILSKKNDEILQSIVSEFGFYRPTGAAEFAASLNEYKSSHEPTTAPSSIPLHNFKKIEKDDYAIKPFRDTYFNDLVQFGRVRPYFVFKSLTENDFYYCVRRAAAKKAAKDIEQGARNIVFHSDLGNGKTIAIGELKCLLFNDGYTVFEATDYNDKIYEDIEIAIRHSGKIAFIFDNYMPYVGAIKSIELKRHADVVLILSARTVPHEIFQEKIATILRAPLLEYDLNRLNTNESSAFSELLRRYGYLTLSHKSAHRLVSQKYNGHIADVLLDRIGSDHISSSISEVINGINHKEHYHEILCLAFILSTMGFVVKTHHLTDILGHSIADRTSFKTDPTVRHFININESIVYIKSSIVSSFVLSKITTGRILADILIKVMHRLDNLSRSYHYYKELSRSLMMYSQIQMIFPDNQKLDSIQFYYESIKNLRFVKYNPLFWLQYGISTYVSGNYSKAEHHFKAAFEYADRITGFDKFQIENQYAHFLLRRSIDHFDKAIFFEVFTKSNEIISRQMGSEKRYYPYRVATHYKDFYDKYNQFFTDEMREYFVASCNYILERITLLKQPLAHNRYVLKAKEHLRYVLKSLSV